MSQNVQPFPDVANLEPEDAKQVLRSKAKARRNARTQGERNTLAELWQPTVMDFLAEAKTVAAFVSINSEPPTRDLCKLIADSGKRLLLPKLGPGLTRAWGFFQGLDDLVVLAPGRPPEPSGPAFDNDILQEVDALIMPALLISKYGERLGQGGGWYDRALKKMQPEVPVGAMVFRDELVDFHLPQDAFDMPIHFALLPDEIVPLAHAQRRGH